MKIQVLPTIPEVAALVAEDIAEFINANPKKLLCFAAGDTTLPVFDALIRLQKENKVNLSNTYYIGLDEWVGLDRKTTGSCAQVMFDEFYEPANIPQENICVWDGLCVDLDAEKRRMEDWISKHSGIALSFLGIGMNGHVGFNEPYIGLPEGTLIVPLDETTKKVSGKYFDKIQDIELGITIGAGELKKAKKIILLATGSGKAEIIKKTVTGEPDESVPASLLIDHHDITLYLDKAAATLINV